ncbi:MAG: YabP/YqfC family sporulation protein [Clostridiales bacterium]|nr:YabP/YqfC family sporulation protein [Clostridiales bacterium]
MFFGKQKSPKSEHEKYKGVANKELYVKSKQEEKERKAERLSYLEIISQNLMLPPDIIAGAPIVTINGRNTICIENHKRILEYTSEKIRVSTKINCLCVEGKNLRVAYYTKEELKVVGMIHKVYYE